MPLFGKPKNTTKKGEITESVILARLVQLGYECLIPWGHDHRYDIAIDDDGKLVRIQCKTARYVEEWGCLEFNTAITYARVGGKPHIRKGYKGEADYFGVYSPDTGKVYLVPVDDVPIGSKARLRLHETKNNQQKGVKWAQDYLRHEAAWVAVETEYSVLNLVFCHQPPTKTCVRSDPEVGQLLGQCTSPGRDQPIREEPLELQASRRLEG